MTPLERERRRYTERTPGSAARQAEALRYLPGGDSRSTLYFEPYPLFLARGEGARLWDVDGHEYLDLSGNHTVLVHGFGHPSVTAAIRDQLELGTCFPEPVALQVDVARLLQERQPSFERVRFCSSGTEAVMNALRGARAATGRPLIAKVEGGYNGNFDDALISTHPTPGEAGPLTAPAPVPRSEGLARSSLTDVVVVPFNDIEATAGVIRRHGADLAAIVVEPVMGSAGMIAAEPDYLAALRRLADEVGALLVFDEVISFRVGYGGAQERYGVQPDLTCLGKMIGGGLPLGVFGGRADVMEVFDPSRGPRVAHPGSMNANPACLAASAATLRALGRDEIEQLDTMGDAVRRGVAAIAGEGNLTVTGLGSLFGLHCCSGPVRGFRDTWAVDRDRAAALFFGLLNDGVFTDVRGAGCVSTATGEEDIDSYLTRFASVWERVAS